MLDESKAIPARTIVQEFDTVAFLSRAYILLTDTSVNNTFSNMMDAINLLYDAGWEVESMSGYQTVLFILMKNTNYKRKNQPEARHD